MASAPARMLNSSLSLVEDAGLLNWRRERLDSRDMKTSSPYVTWLVGLSSSKRTCTMALHFKLIVLRSSNEVCMNVSTYHQKGARGIILGSLRRTYGREHWGREARRERE